ncbi:MAG: VOC family protein [Gemmatimonadota bacterium]
MSLGIQGLHHVTATVSDAASDMAFYTGLLGLRLVKKTVNFDNPGVYHLYYGNGVGSPSTLMTTFPYAGQGVRPGVRGAGQITVTSFSVPSGSLPFWKERLESRRVPYRMPPLRFGAGALEVDDPSGLQIELREAGHDARPPWTGGGVPAEAAVRGIHSVALSVRKSEPSIRFVTALLGGRVVDMEGHRTLISLGKGGAGATLEILEDTEAPNGVNGLGTVHHVALSVPDAEAQLQAREKIGILVPSVTPVRDRQYFTSIYFREPGGILYEVATQGPGFLVDESLETLGQALQLPPWEEENRSAIEARLPPLSPEAS